MVKIVRIERRDIVTTEGEVIGNYVAPILDTGEAIDMMVSFKIKYPTAGEFASVMIEIAGEIEYVDTSSASQPQKGTKL